MLTPSLRGAKKVDPWVIGPLLRPCALSACELSAPGTGSDDASEGTSSAQVTAGSGGASAGSGGGGGAATSTSGSGAAGGEGGCTPAPEACDGLDNDCDGQIDNAEACAACTFDRNGGHAYLVCDTPRSWEAAQQTCHDRGQKLVMIETPAENEWVFERAIGVWDRWFIGAWENRTEGTWVFEDDSPVDYLPWGPDGEPNDGRSENCVGMGFYKVEPDSGEWDDTSCNNEFPFVCEADGH